jgi:glycosyl transferase family 25
MNAGDDSASGLRLFVINLPDATHRRRLMTAQLEQPGGPAHEFIAAVDGRSLSPQDIAKVYDAVAARANSARELSPSEIGCALSHRAAWRAIVDRGLAFGAVLEDDALLGATSLETIQRVLPFLHSPVARLVLLQHVPRYSAWGGIRISRLHRLYRPTRTRGAHAYLLNAAAACKLLAITEPISVVADNWGHFARSVDIRAVVPYCVGRSPASHASQIGPAARRQERRGPLSRLGTRLYDKLVFQLVVRHLRRIRSQPESW